MLGDREGMQNQKTKETKILARKGVRRTEDNWFADIVFWFLCFLVLHALSISQHVKVLVVAGVLSYTKQSIREVRREKRPRGSLRFLLDSKGGTLTLLFKFCQILKGIPLRFSSNYLIILRGFLSTS